MSEFGEPRGVVRSHWNTPRMKMANLEILYDSDFIEELVNCLSSDNIICPARLCKFGDGRKGCSHQSRWDDGVVESMKIFV